MTFDIFGVSPDSIYYNNLESSIVYAQSILSQLAQDSNGFYNVLQQSFGSNYDATIAENLRTAWASGDFSQLPQIVVLSTGMDNALGAYAPSTNTMNGNFHELAIGTTGGGSTPSTAHEELTVYQGDIFAFIVQTFVSGGNPPDNSTTYGAFNVHDFTVKDIPFEFNPLQGVALGLPLFLGLRILKKRHNHKSQSSK